MTEWILSAATIIIAVSVIITNITIMKHLKYHNKNLDERIRKLEVWNALHRLPDAHR